MNTRCQAADWNDSMENMLNRNDHQLKQIKSFNTVGGTCVLVTDQFQCERLIHAGRVVADITDTKLCVLNIQNNAFPTNPKAVQHLFNISSQNGAVMQLIYSENAFRSISQFIKENKILCVVSGMPAGANSFMHRIWNKFPLVHFFTVNPNGKLEEVIHRKTHGLSSMPENELNSDIGKNNKTQTAELEYNKEVPYVLHNQ